MKKIKELAWWFGWFTKTKRLMAIGIVCSSFVLFFLTAYGVRRASDSEHLIWSVISVCIMFITAILFAFFFFVGSSYKYTDSSRNWRLVIDKGWKFANKNHEALSEIENLIEILKYTKDPKELNEFMENWKSPKQKRIELIRKLEHQKEELEEELKEIEAIMSGEKAEQIKEEIEKIKEELRKT